MAANKPGTGETDYIDYLAEGEYNRASYVGSEQDVTPPGAVTKSKQSQDEASGGA